MADKCPICYRNLGTWKKDPILLPNGAPYDWISDTELVFEPDVDNRWYRGVYQISEPEVQELQDALKTLEIDNLLIGDRTTFSPLNTSGKFQITGKHIKEMRDSVEKLLDALGLTKTDYFNYDEDFIHIIHPNGNKTEWTDPITLSTDLTKFQVKGIHIEDLRHKIQSIQMERWNKADVGIIPLDNYNIFDHYWWHSFYGDIGDKPSLSPPWTVRQPELTTIDSVATYPEPVPYGGGWRIIVPPYVYVDKTRIYNIIPTITESGLDKYLSGSFTGVGYSILQAWYHTNWWSEGGFWAGWFSHLYYRTPKYDITFHGMFKNPPIVTENKIFTMDLSCVGTKSVVDFISVIGSPYHIEEIPRLYVSVTLWEGSGGSSTTIYVKSVTDLTTLINGTFTYDLWNNFVKDHPTYKYLLYINLNLYLEKLHGSSTGSDVTHHAILNELTTGSIILNKFDNIGLRSI